MGKVKEIKALEILDSRGNPTLEVVVSTDKGACAVAKVPSGASTGENEAVELRDGDKKRYFGKGVMKAVSNVNTIIAKLLCGKDLDQERLDEEMIKADGTPTKSNFGANAIIGVSLAIARAISQEMKKPLYRTIGNWHGNVLPCPMMNIINGGVHSDAPLDLQEFMIRPKGAPNFREALRFGVEVFQTLKGILKKKGLATAVGDEGGFAPKLSSDEEALETIVAAIEMAGYRPGVDVSIALDLAASIFYDKDSGKYIEKKKKLAGQKYAQRSSKEQVDYIANLCQKFPIDSIEDGLDENDWSGWQYLTQQLGKKIQIVGDDLFVTNVKFLDRGIKEKAANAILIKPNQIGTLSETLKTIQLAKENNFATVISHRSAETEDDFIADLSVATNAGQIKTGSLSRSERIAKYNRLLEIEYELGKDSKFNR